MCVSIFTLPPERSSLSFYRHTFIRSFIDCCLYRKRNRIKINRKFIHFSKINKNINYANKSSPSQAHLHANQARVLLTRSFPISFSVSIFSHFPSPSLHFFGTDFSRRGKVKNGSNPISTLFASAFGCACTNCSRLNYMSLNYYQAISLRLPFVS